MIQQILKLTIILSISAYGTSTYMKPQLALSSQSFQREDVPLSYQFEAVHDYASPEKLEPNYQYSRPHNKREFHKIQFAPLGGTNHKVYESSRKQDEHYKIKIPATELQTAELTRPDQSGLDLIISDLTRPELSRQDLIRQDLTRPDLSRKESFSQDHRSEEQTRKDQIRPDLTRLDQNMIQLDTSQESKSRRLEPRYVKETSYQNIYANIEGNNNVKVLKPGQTKLKEKHYIKHNDNLQFHQAKIPLFVYSPKPIQPTIKNILPAIVSKNQYAFENVPVDSRPKSLHDELEFEKIYSAYKHIPKLHLNTARGFKVPKSAQSLQSIDSDLSENIGAIPMN